MKVDLTPLNQSAISFENANNDFHSLRLVVLSEIGLHKIIYHSA